MATSDQRNQQMKEHIRKTSDINFVSRTSRRDDSQKSQVMEHIKRSLG
jgi:hypothetical protein